MTKTGGAVFVTLKDRLARSSSTLPASAAGRPEPGGWLRREPRRSATAHARRRPCRTQSPRWSGSSRQQAIHQAPTSFWLSARAALRLCVTAARPNLSQCGSTARRPAPASRNPDRSSRRPRAARRASHGPGIATAGLRRGVCGDHRQRDDRPGTGATNAPRSPLRRGPHRTARRVPALRPIARRPRHQAQELLGRCQTVVPNEDRLALADAGCGRTPGDSPDYGVGIPRPSRAR